MHRGTYNAWYHLAIAATLLVASFALGSSSSVRRRRLLAPRRSRRRQSCPGRTLRRPRRCRCGNSMPDDQTRLQS